MIVDKMKNKPETKKSSKLSKEQEVDTDLASAIAVGMLSQPQVMEGFNKMIQSGDPVAMAGQFVATSILKIQEQASQKMNIDPNVWLAGGGVADRMIDQLIMNLEAQGDDSLRGANEEVADEVLNVIKLASKAGQGAPQERPSQHAPMNQGGMV
jgi:hypothetical protein